MTTINWNLNGYKTRLPQLQLLINKYNPEFLCLQETHFKPRDKITLKNYNIYRKDNPNGYRGVAIFVHKNNTSSEVILQTNLQAIAVRVMYPEPCTLCSIYVAPNQTVTYNELNQLINALPTPYILTGDFNAHNPLWNGTHTDQRGKVLEDILEHTTLINNNKPTHFSSQYGTFSTIDLTICDPRIAPNIHWDTTNSLYGSDHYPLIITNLLKQKPISTNNKRWKLKTANWQTFTEEMDKYQLPLTNNTQIDHIIEHFTDAINQAAEKSIEKYSNTPKKRQVPWWNQECYKAIKTHNKALNKYRRYRTTDNFIEYKRTKAIKTRIIDESKKTSWQNYVNKINPQTPIKQIWEKMAKIRGKNIKIQTTTLIKNNITYTDPQQITDILAETISKNSSNDHYKPNFLQYKHNMEQNGITINDNNEHPLNVAFTMWELDSTINNLNDNKSPGPDQIPYEFIKHFSENTKKQLLELYNHIWNNNIFPNTWKEVIIIPILKPNKDQTDPANYRPIALANALCKIMEKLVNKRLSWHLETNKLITNSQNGFRPGRTTTDSHLTLLSEIHNSFKNGQHMVAIFFDLEKAFDTTWRLNILKNLKEDNIDGHILHFIKNFLTDRRFKTKSHGHTSNTQTQENGIPQGASLSATLFLKAINKITSHIKYPCKSLLYADDLVIYCRGNDIDTIQSHLQNVITEIQQWTDTTGFNFSPTKTKMIHFCKQRKTHPHPKLTIENQTIPRVRKIKFLGLIFDEKLTWKDHINELRTDCFRRLNIMKSIANHSWGAHMKSMITIYKMIIRSKIDYGAIAYSTASPTTLQRLDAIQNTALRLATGAFCTSPVTSIQNLTGEMPLSLRRKILAAKHIIKTANNEQHPLFEHLFIKRNNKITLKQRNTLQTYSYNIFDSINIPFPKTIQGKTINPLPPWLQIKPNINLELTKYHKDETNTMLYHQEYLKIKDSFREHVQYYTDASKNHKQVGAAVVTPNNTYKYKLAETTSTYTAEIYAIRQSLEIITNQEHQTRRYAIYTDSLSSLQTISNIYPKNNNVQKIQHLITQLQQRDNVEVILVWVPSHIGIAGNEAADAAAKDASLTAELQDEPIHTDDLISLTTQNITKQWKEEWTNTINNKLRAIKNTTNSWIPDLKRKDQIIINRLRIGHTRITDTYRLQRTAPPQCERCNTTLTVEHLIIVCTKYQNIRNTLDIPPTLHEALKDNIQTINKIIKYVTKTNLTNKI